MKCRKCGAELLDTDTFCVKCGQRVDGLMLCPGCGEKLREGERFCHKCGIPVGAAPEDDEIPLSRQKTVDIPFDEIEQGILLEAKQAIVKRPEAEKSGRRSTEGYSRPGAEEDTDRRQVSDRDLDGYRDGSAEREAGYRQKDRAPVRAGREIGYYGDDGPAVRQTRRQTPRPRYEEYDDYEEEDEEDSGDSKMKVVTVILGIAVVAIGLAIGFILWQRNRTPGEDGPGEIPGQEEQGGAENGEGDAPLSADTVGRIQILSNVNVRNKPTTEGSEVLMVAKTGEIYEYYELVDDAWYHIKLEDGEEGYVSKNYVEDLQ